MTVTFGVRHLSSSPDNVSTLWSFFDWISGFLFQFDCRPGSPFETKTFVVFFSLIFVVVPDGCAFFFTEGRPLGPFISGRLVPL